MSETAEKSSVQADSNQSQINPLECIVNEQAISSTSTKLEDFQYKENFLTSSFREFFEPIVKKLDSSVETLRDSQLDLGSQIDELSSQMKAINDSLHKQIDLDEYTKRLTNTKKRVNSVLATILAIEERLNRIHNILRKDQALQQQKQ